MQRRSRCRVRHVEHDGPFIVRPDDFPEPLAVHLPLPIDTPASWLARTPANDDDRLHRSVMLDVDGILVSFMTAYSAALGGVPFDETDSPRWGELPVTPSPEEKRRAMRAAHSAAGIRSVGLLAGAREGVAAWKAHGLRVVIVTRRDADLGPETRATLAELGLEVDDFYAGADLDKLALCERLGLGIVVDDKPTLLRAARDAGCVAASLRWPYHAELAGEEGIDLCDDWTQLSERVLMHAQFRSRRARGLV